MSWIVCGLRLYYLEHNVGRSLTGCQQWGVANVPIGGRSLPGEIVKSNNRHPEKTLCRYPSTGNSLPGARFLLPFIFASILISSPVTAQDTYFGQNKVQYKDFKWSIFKTEHFEFYYHEGGQEIAEFAAVASEKAYQDLRHSYHFDLTQRVPVILYNSHNDFQQTNVVSGILQEGIGGFTEYLKHRVVVPFQGSYEDFRHVLHHELVHAVSMAMIYGTGIASLISQAQSGSLPLWFAEGLAEYGSQGWDMDSDAFIRDAVITGYLPPLNQIRGGFLAYKGGQAFFHYLVETYGAGRIGELLSSLRLLRNVDRAFIATVGKPVEDLSEDWHRYLKRIYWPEIEKRDLPDEFATPLTDHNEDGSTYNIFPAFSPAGDRVAFISNRRQYMDLYVISTLDGTVLSRLGKGEQVGQFEEMHILRGGVTWSPDGSMIAVAAKGGRNDRIYIIDAEKGNVLREIDPSMDGVFEPAWNPDGLTVAFVGIEDGFSDLYLYDLETDQYTRLTRSKAYESSPSWSSDGSRLAYVSDILLPGREPIDHSLPVPYGPKNIWIMDMRTSDLRAEPVIAGPFDDLNPLWGPRDESLIFISMRSGIRNLYQIELENGHIRPLSNILSGMESAHLSTASNEMVFSAFNGAGYDLFLLKDPLNSRVEKVVPTRMVEEMEQAFLEAATRPIAFTQPDSSNTLGDLSKLRFIPLDASFRSGEERTGRRSREKEPLTRDLGAGISASEERPYKLKLTPDLVLANAGYTTYWGLAGSSYMEMSDILGNHRFAMMVSLWSTLDNSNYEFSYIHLGKRWNFGASAFWYNYFYLPERNSRAIYGDRTAGGAFLLSYPFSRFMRLDLETFMVGIYRKIYLTGPAQTSYRQILMPKLSLVGDNTLPGYTGYINGRRYSLGLSHSPPWMGKTLRFTSLSGDYRSYARAGKGKTFVFRIAAGLSEGRRPQRFFLGGNGFWWGPRYTSSELYEIENLYFATFQAPLRGFDFYEFSGTRFILTNLEFRFPLIQLLALGWPLPAAISNIQGVMFCDMGMAWDKGDVHPFETAGSLLGFDDLKSGVGFGARVNMGIFILKLDVAWKNTLMKIGGSPRWHIALGPEF